LVAALLLALSADAAGPADADLFFDSSSAAVCGWWANSTFPTGAAIGARYGEVRSCGPLDATRSVWVITTLGTSVQRGVVAVDRCLAVSCTDGRLDHPPAAWSIHVSPFRGGVTWLGLGPPGVIVVDAGGHQIAFDVAAGRYSTG
jgi:hypothetical protein